MNGADLPRVLCVDDEVKVLQGLSRTLHRRYSLLTAVGPEAGLEEIASSGPFAVVVSDMRMPGMDGAAFLGCVRERAPDTVRILLTGHTDISAAIEAVNRGSVFRFLTKPCPPEVLTGALDEAVQQYRLVTTEKDLLERTLKGAIKVLTEILSLANPAAFSRAERLKAYVSQMAAHLGLANAWQYEVAAMLSQVGCVTLPSELLAKVDSQSALSPEEHKLVSNYSEVGFRLLAGVPRLDRVAAMIRHQRDPAGISAEDAEDVDVVTGARLLYTAIELDTHLSQGYDTKTALKKVRAKVSEFDRGLLDALESVEVIRPNKVLKTVTLDQLTTFMVLAEEVRAENGLLLVAAGQNVTAPVIERLHGFAKSVGVVEPIWVYACH
jgi:FixJ family two-component response regulator